MLWRTKCVANTPYTVEVASYAGGVWSAYGNPCTVTTSATVPRYNPFLAEEGKVEAAAAELGLSIYPNPTAVNETYYIELNGIQQANENVAINIYNVLGAKVYSTQGNHQRREPSSVTTRANISCGCLHSRSSN
jgi:hypothetical protein